MIPLDIIFEPERWAGELAGKEIIEAEPKGISVIDKGTTSGRPSVFIRVDLDGDRVIMAQTSARLFCTAAKMIMAKYPDLFEGD
jgi:hypothetical protein